MNTILPRDKNKLVILLITLLIAANFVVLSFATPPATGSGAQKAGKGINCIICKVAQLIFMIVASLATIIIIIAGVRWLTSGDDPGARTAAKNTIVSAFVGIIIIFVAIYVVSFVVGSLVDLTTLGVDPATWVTSCQCDQMKIKTT